MPEAKTVFVHALAAEVPEHSYTQSFALSFLLELQGDTEKKRTFLKRVYANTGIDKRHTVIDDYGKPPEEYTFFPKNERMTPEPDTAARNDKFVTEAGRLSVRCARGLFEKSPQIQPGAITHLITVSCTGFSVPGFDIEIVKALPLSPSVQRFHIGFMGCYASFPALRLASDICLAHPEASVLIVSVELCSLHFQQTFVPDTVVADAIFADGCAAALVSARPPRSGSAALRLDRFSSIVLPDSENEMAWRIGRHGFDMRLSLYVPGIIEANLGRIVDDLLREGSVARQEIDLFALHPGGRAILDRAADTLKIEPHALQDAREVLREFGNMSSATIFFVLKRILENATEGRIFAAAFGPGLTVESGLMQKVIVR